MARTPTRTALREEPEARVPERKMDDGKIRNRKGEVVSLQIKGDEDPFDFKARGIKPDEGWTYEWKVKSIYNWEHTQHQVMLSRNGWEPVPASRHDGLYMPKGHQGPIEYGGQILMERDARLTAQSRAYDKRAADAAVLQSRRMAGQINSSMVDFDHPEARRATGVRTDRMPVLNEAMQSNAYSVDDE